MEDDEIIINVHKKENIPNKKKTKNKKKKKKLNKSLENKKQLTAGRTSGSCGRSRTPVDRSLFLPVQRFASARSGGS